MHGVSRVDSAESTVVKIAWILMILLSLSAGSYIIYNSLSEYYAFDVITNVERVRPPSVPLPSVTLCHTKIFKKEVFVNDTSKEEITMTINLTMREFVYDFQDERGTESYCNKLEYFENDVHGDCVRFNGLKLDKLNSDSRHYTILLRKYLRKDISEDEYHVYRLLFPFVYVYVGDNYLNSIYRLKPDLEIEQKSETANKHYFQIIKTETEHKLGWPYNRCDSSRGVSYRQSNCIDICINREIWNKYGCSIPGYYRNNEHEPCGATGIVEDYYYGFLVDDSDLNTTAHINEFYDSCERECPKECETVTLATTVTDGWYMDVRYSIAYFVFRYKDLSTLEITQIPKMTTYDLISNVGGTLGLFVGISFLSFVEFFQLIFEIFLIMCSFKLRAWKLGTEVFLKKWYMWFLVKREI